MVDCEHPIKNGAMEVDSLKGYRAKSCLKHSAKHQISCGFLEAVSSLSETHDPKVIDVSSWIDSIPRDSAFGFDGSKIPLFVFEHLESYAEDDGGHPVPGPALECDDGDMDVPRDRLQERLNRQLFKHRLEGHSVYDPECDACRASREFTTIGGSTQMVHR